MDEQLRLADFCRWLDGRGVLFMLTNSATPEMLDLYRSWHVQRLEVVCNLNPAHTQPRREMVVTNYRPQLVM